MSDGPDTLLPAELDALQEMVSVGCGQALSSLGRLIKKRLDMDVPETWAGRSPGAIADFLGALGQDLVAVAVRLEGLLAGHLVLALPEEDAARLAAALGYPVQATGWGSMAESALMESGNIVGSAFVSAVAQLVKQKLLLSVPRLARGGGRQCLDALVPREEGAVALATRFSCSEPPGPLEGLILFMPEPGRVRPLLEALGRA
ncbi:MAG TPA: chemotaxis protein CheC [Anaeromyxobacteraceae bacterium]|nr:chemotaxis protein CheC [Anaeromyxobacteraceae bacterium]